MATVYSLICWGGKNGKSVTGAVATDLITLTNHGLRTGTAVVPQATVSGVTSGTTYYARSVSANTFTLHPTLADANANTNITNITAVTAFTLKSKYYVDLSDKSRWTYSTVEYIFDGLAAWRTYHVTTNPALATDEHVCEIGMAWDDRLTATINLTLPVGSILVTTTVNGSRSDAFHNGSFTSGYCAYLAAAYLKVQVGLNTTLDGIRVYAASTDTTAVEVGATGRLFNTITEAVSKTSTNGISTGSYCVIENCVVSGFLTGIYCYDYTVDYRVSNCTVIKNTTGFKKSPFSSTAGNFYNNIAIGNTTNWEASPTGVRAASKNAGGTSEAWVVGAGTRIEVTEASPFSATFVDYTGNNFIPASISSQLVDVGVTYYGILGNDVSGAERPSYENGATTYHDVGAYEFDHGYGPTPQVRTIDFSGLISGSQVVIYTTNTTTELARNDSTGTTYSYDAAASGVTVDYTILKTGYVPIRVTGVALTATSTPVVVQQGLDRAYATPSGLTFGTNAIVNVTARVVTSLQVTASTTVQNWYSTLMDAWIASSTNTTLKNVAFPVIPFGEASFTVINGIEFSDGATSISKFKRDGLRYSSNAGTTITAIWAAILTLNTPAGQQVKYRQSPAGSIVNAANTGPMDQLVQVMSDPNGDGNYADGYDYRGHMVLRAPKVGWSQPKPDLVATYGNLVDGLFVTGLEPILQYATTDADIDAANLVLNNTTKTFTITAAHTMLEIYQRAQWWANQDAQWDADIPLTTTNGATFTQPSNWSMLGAALLSGGTLAGGSATLVAGTQGIAYNGVTLNLGAEGTYTATITSSIVKFSPTANAVTYGMGLGSFSGTIDLRNTHATRAITVEVPAGATVITTNNTGAAITVSAPALARGITFTGLVAGSTVKVYETATTSELFSDTNSATSETWSEATAGSRTVDYTIQRAGYLPIRVVGVTVTAAVTGGVVTVQIAQIQSRAYQFV